MCCFSFKTVLLSPPGKWRGIRSSQRYVPQAVARSRLNTVEGDWVRSITDAACRSKIESDIFDRFCAGEIGRGVVRALGLQSSGKSCAGMEATVTVGGNFGSEALFTLTFPLSRAAALRAWSNARPLGFKPTPILLTSFSAPDSKTWTHQPQRGAQE